MSEEECRIIVLVGPRAAGKTTLAKLLAERLNYAFADADDLLAASVGCPAGEYLASQGEPAFRAAEQSIVTEALAANAGRVLSLGGGAVLAENVRDLLARPTHFVVFVSAPVSVLVDGFGTETVDAEELERLVRRHFDLTPRGIIETLRLRRPIYRATSYHGHFGREDAGFPWEQTNRAEALRRDAAE